MTSIKYDVKDIWDRLGPELCDCYITSPSFFGTGNFLPGCIKFFLGEELSNALEKNETASVVRRVLANFMQCGICYERSTCSGSAYYSEKMPLGIYGSKKCSLWSNYFKGDVDIRYINRATEILKKIPGVLS